MADWWRDAVFYEIYVRSFADSDGDGLGDLPGIRSRLRYVRDLGVDAIWLTPFYPSPDADHGYDVADYVDVDPRFGTLADFDGLVRDAHDLGLRVIVDIVPNHTSRAHPWFREHPDYYVWADEIPNNWPAVWGGPAWSYAEGRGRYYLHLFAPEQPDLDWHNPAVQEEFDRILRFWLDRGADGFRIDVAWGLFKDPELRDEEEPFPEALFTSDWRRATDQPEVHPLYRRWRKLVDGYSERVLVGEVTFTDPARVAPYVRDDELHLAFNFTLLFAPWDARAMRDAIDRTCAAIATPTWVLESHDVPRLPTRYGSGRRARAAALLLLALPGPVFLYAGQELGLEEVDLPDEVRQDPVFFRSGGARVGRDGVRVPLPWSADPPSFGFTTGTPWLPMPETWAQASVAAQERDETAFLALYRSALAIRRRSRALRAGSFAWRESAPGTLSFERAAGDEVVVCSVSVDGDDLELPAGEVLLADESAVWVRAQDEGRQAPDAFDQ